MDLFRFLFFIFLVILEIKASFSQQEPPLEEFIHLPAVGRSSCHLQGDMMTCTAATNDIAPAQSQTQTQQKDNLDNSDQQQQQQQPITDLSVVLSKGMTLPSERSNDDECSFDWDRSRTCTPKCWCLFLSPYGLGCVRTKGCFFTEKKGIGHVDKPFILIPPT